MNANPYTYHDEKTGRVCCSADNPTYLCDKCKERHSHIARILSETPQQAAARLTRETNEMFARHGYPRAASRSDVTLDGTVMRRTTGDPYRAAMSSRANERREVLENPEYWGDYDPRGNAPDGYAIALGLKHLEAEDAAKEKR